MKIEIITTGDEVVQGVITDTNSAWIAGHCAKLGHEVIRHTSVADYTDAIGDALTSAGGRADAVIVSGGLGPTSDDLTIEAAARAFGVKLIRDDGVLQDIREFFARVGRPMSSSNEKQALIPEGGEVLTNRVGTAPGISIRLGNAQFFFLPGVPMELYQIFEDSVLPWLEAHAAGGMCERILRCFGCPEASIDEKLKGVDLTGTRLSFRVKFPEIILKVVARTDTPSDANEAADAAAQAIHERLGDIVYAEGETTLSQVVGTMLEERGLTIAVAESCTGGLMANIITDVPGSSAYFERGVVAYSNRSKTELLGVAEKTIEAHGSVSSQTAISMAEGIKKISGASVGVAITGIAGPGGATPAKPVGTVYIAIATPKATKAHEYHFGRDRLSFKQVVAWTALDIVRRYLLND